MNRFLAITQTVILIRVTSAMDSATALRRIANDLILIADTVDVHGVETRAARARRAAGAGTDTDASAAADASATTDASATAGTVANTVDSATVGTVTVGASETRYNKDTSINEEKLGAFLMASLCPDIRTIVGVGPTNHKILIANGYETTHQLLGLFMTCMRDGFTSQKVCDRFANLLKDMGVHSSRNNIVRCVAEKVNTFIPGAYNEEELD